MEGIERDLKVSHDRLKNVQDSVELFDCVSGTVLVHGPCINDCYLFHDRRVREEVTCTYSYSQCSNYAKIICRNHLDRV